MMVRVATDHDTPLAIDRYFIGFRVPMLHAPAGLCYLAYCDDEKRFSILDLVKRSSGTLGLKPSLDADLEYTLDLIRRQGFCHIRFAQYREGGLAVPLFADGKVVGGIVMRYMKLAMKTQQLEDHYVPIVKQLAVDIATAYNLRLNNESSSSDDDESVSLSGPDDAMTPPPKLAAIGRPPRGIGQGPFRMQSASG